MKKYSFIFLLSTMLILCNLSCADDKKECEEVLTPVKKIEATMNSDFDTRTDWIFMVATTPYKHNLVDNKIVATPISDKMTFSHTTYVGNNCPQNQDGMFHALYFHFVSPEWVENSSSDNFYDRQLSILYDQSTLDKQFSADALKANIGGAKEEYLDVKLRYMYDKLSYSFVDLPPDAEQALKMVVGSGVNAKVLDIKPYLNDDIYQALALHNQVIKYGVELKIADKIYKKEIDMSTDSPSPYRDAYNFSFAIKYNKDQTDEAKVLTIENMKYQKRDK